MAISINDVVINFHFMATNLYGTAWICERANFHHSRILEQIKAHSAEGARRAMEEHMVFARRVMEEIEAGVGREAFQPAEVSPAGTGPAPAGKGVEVRSSER
jgi:DNA-binding GntR family transcriptional regulator